jgi:hypothetical protein
MTQIKTCEKCGKHYDLLDLPETKDWTDLKLVIWNCECKSTLSVKSELLKQILLNNCDKTAA